MVRSVLMQRYSGYGTLIWVLNDLLPLLRFCTGSLALTALLQIALGRWRPVRFEQLCLAPGDGQYAFDDTDFATATMGCPSQRMAWSAWRWLHANSWDGLHWTWSLVVPTPTVFAESTAWGVGNRLQTPTKVLMRSGHFNVQHDVHVQFSFSHFDTACSWTGPWWGLSCQSQQTVIYFLQAATLWCFQGGSLWTGWYTQSPLGGWEYIYCKSLQDAIAATGSQQFSMSCTHGLTTLEAGG